VPYRDPDRQRAAKAESARRARSGTPRGTRPLVSGELRITTARDVLAVIDGQVDAVLGDDALGTAERARVLATLCGCALRSIEAADLAARVEALERALESRRAAA
jgi:hypothetical protein